MEFLGFYTFAVCCGLGMGVLIGTEINKIKKERRIRALLAYRERAEAHIMSLETALNNKADTINMWCKRLNKKKQVMGNAKNKIKKSLMELCKQTDAIFKE